MLRAWIVYVNGSAARSFIVYGCTEDEARPKAEALLFAGETITNFF